MVWSGGWEKGKMKGGINGVFWVFFFKLGEYKTDEGGGGTLINNQCLLAKQYQDNSQISACYLL